MKASRGNGRGRARARRTDPPTSHAAAALAEMGSAKIDRALCLRVVIEHPGLTAAEIAKRIGLERHASSRRLPELRQDGVVYNGPARLCEIQGRLSITWYPVL